MWEKEVHVVEEWSLLFLTGGELGDAAKSQGTHNPQGNTGSVRSTYDPQSE